MSENGARPPIVITHAGGVKFSIRIRSHEIMVDQPVAAGGDDSAPAPIELLAASLGSCVAYYVYNFFHARGLPADDLRVELTQRGARNPSRVESFAVRITLPTDLPAKYVPLLERVVESCPAHNTLQMGAKIDVEFLTPVPASV